MTWLADQDSDRFEVMSAVFFEVYSRLFSKEGWVFLAGPYETQDEAVRKAQQYLSRFSRDAETEIRKIEIVQHLQSATRDDRFLRRKIAL